MIYDNPDNWFLGTPKKTKKSKGAGGGGTPTKNRISQNSTQKLSNSIKATNKKVPQAMVKISGSSNGTNKAQAHANYIGRKGSIEIENQDGNKFIGEEQKQLLKSWEAMGMHKEHDTGTRKEAFHFVFSMPKGTDPEGLKNAVRNLINEEFEGHKYFMAQHLDTDSPHVHVLLSATDDRGARLNPRKADLHNYRVQFASKLVEQGIEATASRRIHRFKYKDNSTQKEIHKAKKEGKEIIKSSPTFNEMQKIKKTHKEIETIYKAYSEKLPQDAGELKKDIKQLLKEVDKDKGRG